MKKEKNGATLRPMEQVDQAAMHGQELTKDQVRDYLVRDVKGIYVLLADILNTPEVMEALATAIYARYERFQEQKKAAPELDLKPQD